MQDAREPRCRNAQASKTRILAAARAVFCELGYSQIGIRDIAPLEASEQARMVGWLKQMPQAIVDATRGG